MKPAHFAVLFGVASALLLLVAGPGTRLALWEFGTGFQLMRWAAFAGLAAAGRIEATDTTFWFGFKDDVVIRVEADGAGSRVDVRSVSRVGVGDVGTNATRIRAYLQKLGAWR
jgi:hypothetical protein